MDRSVFRPFLVFAALLSIAAPAAATPLPAPPFGGGGFIAPSSEVLRLEENVIKLLLKITKADSVCDWNAVTGLQLAYTPANPTKIEDLQEKWTACVQKNDQRYATIRDKLQLVTNGPPPCLDAAAIDTVRAVWEAARATASSVIYCDGDGADPDPVTGLTIPDAKKETVGETAVAKLVVKAWHHTSKCYSKAAKLAFKRNEYGETLSDRDLESIQRCLDKVALTAQEDIAELEQRQKLPGCLSATAANGAVTDVMAAVGSSTGMLYCAE